MNEKINIDISTIKIIYGKYKQHIFFILTILVCLILFLTVIISRTKELWAFEKETKNEAKKLATLRNNLDLLLRTDDSTLNSQLRLVSQALPVDKNFEGVLNAISNAAIKSGVALSDYEFQVGDLSETAVKIPGFPSLKLSLNTRASPKQTPTFINELFQSLPLSEVTSIDQGGSSSTITIVFYYKPIPQIQFNDEQPIPSVSAESLKLINKLSSWNYSALPNNLTFPVSSTSASPF